jgi:eukaryotic-like serine/threonine-protein kinase
MLLEGQQFDRYRLELLIGRGGMSEIYLAEDSHLHRQVAVKVLQIDITSFSNTKEMNDAIRLFQVEAKAISTLDHPHILPLFDYGEESIKGTLFAFLVMPYRREGSLANWIRLNTNSGTLSLEEVSHIVQQASDALQFAHNHQIIHRDVKPSNFLIYSGNEYSGFPDLQLADFGVAKFMNAVSSTNQIVRGTPIYMAPEQWRGEAVPATDQYALAVMVYEFLAGHPPFEGDNQQKYFYQHNYVQPQPPSSFNPYIPEEIDNVLMRALLKNAESRYTSISKFARAFQQAIIHRSDVPVTLTISQSEAQTGTRRLVPFPGGGKVTVNVPAGAYNGQVIRLQNVSEHSSETGTTYTLIVTIAIKSTEEIVTLSSSDVLERTVPVFDNNTASNNRQQGSFNGRTLLIGGLAILLLLGGFGLLFQSIITNQQADTNRINATATGHSETAIAQFNANATSQANATASASVNLTDTAFAENATATASAATATATASAANATATAASIAANATATASSVAATATAYVGTIKSGTPGLNDPMQDNSQGNNWDEVTIVGGGGCAFVQGAYESNMPQKGYFSPCFARNTNLINFSYQVQMTIVRGDQGGISFRADAVNGTFYYFYINTNGSFGLEIFNNYVLSGTLKQGSSPAIKTGLNQTNLIAVVANGDKLDLYVNMQLIASANDNTYSQGQIGVVAENINNPTDVLFRNAQIYAM